MNKTYTFSDIHGCYNILKHILNYMDDTDKAFFLGDACDRGSDGIKCIMTLKSDPRIIYLKGNHEEVLANAVPSLWDDMHYNDFAMAIWFQNGGEKTLNELNNLSEIDQKCLVHWINSLPYERSYTNPKGERIILEHAGYTPFDIPHRSHDPLWDREHFHDIWRGKNQKVYMVHGHTPTEILKFYFGYEGQKPFTDQETEMKREFQKNHKSSWRPSVIKYCSGHKIDIDLGVFYKGVAALLDLDTLEPIYFDENGVIENYEGKE